MLKPRNRPLWLAQHYGRRHRLPVCVERRAGCHEDINDKSLTLGMTEAAKLLNKQLERGKIDGLKLAGVISTIHPTLDYAGFDRVDVVVEAVVETRK